jgi:SAM-dependent methyltransferase
MLDLARLATNIEQATDGIWYTKNRRRVSYPARGNADCYQLEDTSFWFRHRNNCIVEACRQLPPRGPLFDVGGGNGFVALGLEQAGFETVLIEPGATGAANARSRNLAHVICATVEDAKFQPGTLDAVGLFDVVEHIEDDAAFLGSLSRLMPKNGRIYLTVPAHAALWSDEDELAGHFRRYTRASLQTVLVASGFAVEFATYFFAPLPLPILLVRALPSRLGVRQAAIDQAKHVKQHKSEDGVIGTLLERAWRWEVDRIRALRPISIGSSCLAVARVA